MSPHLALWFLWTALSLCLPGATQLELCLCDGPRGLFDGAACGMAGEEDAVDCCCEPDQDAEPRLERQGERGCGCVTLEAQRSEPVAHAIAVPATVLRAAPTQDLRSRALPASTSRVLRGPRARVRTRVPDGLPLRI